MSNKALQYMSPSPITPISEEERRRLKVSEDLVKRRGGWFIHTCTESLFIQYLYYGLKLDILMNKFSKSYAMRAEKACKEYLLPEEYSDRKLVKSIKKHMFHCLKICKSKPEEYFIYGFRNKTDDEIRAYLTDSSMMEILSKTGARKLHNVELSEKCNFYKITSPWFKRDVALIESASDFDVFANILRRLGKVIVKPASDGCGSGIFICEYKDEQSTMNSFAGMMQKGKSYIVEELIEQDTRMSIWNESSVNTLRINTFKNHKGVFNHICFMRTGRSGSLVDNGGAGGIFAIIDDKTGRLCSDGKNEHLETFIKHPDSGITFYGWQIPDWDNVLCLAKTIHEKVFPKHPYIGWDFALSNKGWVLIEGNWGQFVCQQICLGHGLKEEVTKLLNE